VLRHRGLSACPGRAAAPGPLRVPGAFCVRGAVCVSGAFCGPGALRTPGGTRRVASRLLAAPRRDSRGTACDWPSEARRRGDGRADHSRSQARRRLPASAGTEGGAARHERAGHVPEALRAHDGCAPHDGCTPHDEGPARRRPRSTAAALRTTKAPHDERAGPPAVRGRVSASRRRPWPGCRGRARSPWGRRPVRGRCPSRRCGPGRARSRGRRSAGSDGRSARP
jgi:hypothetical protein